MKGKYTIAGEMGRESTKIAKQGWGQFEQYTSYDIHASIYVNLFTIDSKLKEYYERVGN